MEIIGARHESAAVQMADGWARATGTPGIAIVTGGPTHQCDNSAAVAQGAQSPVVIISAKPKVTADGEVTSLSIRQISCSPSQSGY